MIKRYHPELAQGKSDQDIDALRTDQNLSMEMIDRYGNENGKYLDANDIPVNDASKYGAHWFGPAGFLKIYNADPSAPIESIIGEDAAKRNSLTGKTVGDVKGMIARKMDMDYVPLSLSDTLSLAGHNLWPDMKSVASGLASSVIHPLDTLHGMGMIGSAIRSKIDSEAGRQQSTGDFISDLKTHLPQLAQGRSDEELAAMQSDPSVRAQVKAAVEAPVDRLIEEYKEKYGSEEGLKQALAYHPAGVLLDLSTLLSGGELAAGKVGQVVGKVGTAAGDIGRAVEGAGSAGRAVAGGLGKVERGLTGAGEAIETGANVVGKVGTSINPLNPLGVFTPEKSVLPIANRGIFDRTGNFTPKVDRIIRSVSDGALSAEDFSEQAARDALAGTIRSKGLTPESVREGILRAQGLEAPASITTGKAAPLAAQGAADAAVAGNAAKLGAQAKNLTAGALSDTALAENLEKAFADSRNAASAKYAAIHSVDGKFDPGALGGMDIRNKVADNLKTSGFLDKNAAPQTAFSTAFLKGQGLDQSAEAVKLLSRVLDQGKTLLSGDMTASEILRLRQQLNRLRDSATGQDIKAMHDITNAFDSHVADAAARGLFKNSKGVANTDLANQITEANDAYRTHMGRFENTGPSNANIGSAVRKLRDQMTRDANGDLVPSGNSDLYREVHATLEKDLMHPSKGGNTYSNLVDAVGGPGSTGESEINNHIRNMVLNNDNGILIPPKNITPMLKNTNSVVHRAFAGDPAMLHRVRRIHAAHRINMTKPESMSAKKSLLKGVIAPMALRAGATAIGASQAGLPGAIIGHMIEQGGENILARRAIAKELLGAPDKRGIIKKATSKVGSLTRPLPVNISRMVQDVNQQKEAAATGGRIERASGGKVDGNVEHLTNRLMRALADAKKATDATTEPLLNAPDEAIVKALGVANKAI